MSKIKWLVLFFFLFGCLGYFREFFFVHLNNIMYQKYYGTSSTLPIPRVMEVFTHSSYASFYFS
jgi:hypothetical protein